MTEHTPGPWRADEYDCVFAGGSTVVANCLNSGIPREARPTPDQSTANARLIAGAPDMLAALEAISSISPPTSSDKIGAPTRVALKKVRAAIAKARGQS